MYLYVYIYSPGGSYVYICFYIFIYVYVYTCLYSYVYMHLHVYLYTYICNFFPKKKEQHFNNKIMTIMLLIITSIFIHICKCFYMYIQMIVCRCRTVIASSALDVRRVLFTIKLLHTGCAFLCLFMPYWPSLCISRRIYRQNRS
jgi:hypothetical protein